MKLQYLWIDFEQDFILTPGNKHGLIELHETCGNQAIKLPSSDKHSGQVLAPRRLLLKVKSVERLKFDFENSHDTFLLFASIAI